jgi:sugar-specific transcriptional regulator TrmB
MPEKGFQRFWKRLQRTGLNAYEARAYLVLVGHPRFKALELASRARVPRQKVYEVLDSLVEKGFALVVKQKTKLFSAVEPSLAIPAYVARKRKLAEQDFTEQARTASALALDLTTAYSKAQGERGTLDYLRIISDQEQTAAQYRAILSSVQSEYVELSRPPFAVDPLDEKLVKAACRRGVRCRLLMAQGTLDEEHRQRFDEYQHAGVEIRLAESLPLKLALFDSRQGLIALLDPVVTAPTWTSLVFDHSGLGEAMQGLFEDHWARAEGAALGAATSQ